MIVRSLWLIIMLLHHGGLPVGAAGRTTVARPMIQPFVVLSWTPRMAVITAALAATATNRLLETARTLLDRVFQDLARGPLAAAFVVFGDSFITQPVPPPGANRRGYRSPNLAQSNKSGPSTSTNTRQTKKTTETKIKKASRP